MEFLKLILVLIICIGLSFFVAYKMVLFFSDEKQRKTRNFFQRNQRRKEAKLKQVEKEFGEQLRSRKRAFEKAWEKIVPPIAAAMLILGIVELWNLKNNQVVQQEVIQIGQQQPIEKRKIEENPPPIPQEKIEEIYSWVDETGKKHYSNQKITQQGNSRETPVIITKSNSILVPVIIGHNGKAIKITMVLDTGCGLTMINRQVANLIRPDFVRKGKSTIADGREIDTEHIRLDFIQVGPFMEQNFEASTSYVQNSDQLDYQGLLGMEFLKRHPFQIDHQHSVIRWM